MYEESEIQTPSVQNYTGFQEQGFKSLLSNPKNLRSGYHEDILPPTVVTLKGVRL